MFVRRVMLALKEAFSLMLRILNNIYKKERIYPSYLSIFTNPYYFVRKGLTYGIKLYAHHIQGVVLDFGCGTKPYRESFIAKKYIGVDVPVSGHDHSGEPIDIFYNGKVLPFQNESFDSIFCTEALEHIFNPDEMLDELHRVLKGDGKMLLTLPFAWAEHEPPYDFARYTSYGIADLLVRHNFEVLELRKSNNHVEALFQMWNAYIFQLFYTKNHYLDVLFTLFFIAPVTIMGLVFSRLLPKKDDLFNSIIVLVRKVS